MTPIEDILRPPGEAEVKAALGRFARLVREAYGERLEGLYLFGSRARGDHRPDSDADVAVVLKDGDWAFWDEKMRLTDLSYDLQVDLGLYIQPWPFAEADWAEPSTSPRRELIEAARSDARPLRLEP